MNSDADDRPTQPKNEPVTDPDGLSTRSGDPDVAGVPVETEAPVLASSPGAESDEDRLPGDAVGPAPGESLSPAIDGASRPDKVAIAMMVGVIVLLLICVAFAFAAR